MLTKADISILYDKHYAAILRYLTAVTGNPETAKDLTQDTYLELCKISEITDMSDNIQGLLYKIAHCNLVDYFRRCNETNSGNDIYTDEHAHGSVERCSYEDRMEIVRACDQLLELPDLLRRTMYRFIGGNTPKAISEQDGRTESAVRVRIHRARRIMHSMQGSGTMP